MIVGTGKSEISRMYQNAGDLVKSCCSLDSESCRAGKQMRNSGTILILQSILQNCFFFRKTCLFSLNLQVIDEVHLHYEGNSKSTNLSMNHT